MKKLSVLALAAVGLLAGACSTDKDIAEQGGVLDGKGKGYLNVSVNLPTQPNVSTRGWLEKGQLDDGENYEYAVDNVLLAVFGGADEATATLKQVVVQNTEWVDPEDTPDQITRTSKNIVFKLNQETTGPNLYILAALNYSEVLTADANAGTITTKGNGAQAVNVTTISSLQNALILTEDATTKFRNGNGRFFMTNAVLSNKKSGDEGLNNPGNAVVLAPVTYIHESETAAAAEGAKPSAEVFVERGLAKVEVKGTPTPDNGITDADGNKLAAASVSLYGWVLDNTNKKSYIARKTFTDTSWGLFSDYAAIDNNDRFRFVGFNPVKPQASNDAVDEYGNSLYYRSYWAIDPNYQSDAAAGDFYEPKTKSFATGADAAKPQYCFENTFNVEHQTYKNTTRAVVAIKFNGGQDFYTLAGDRKTLYTLADIQDVARKALLLNTTFTSWFSTNFSGKELNNKEMVKVNWKKDKAGLVRVKTYDITIDGTTKTFDNADVIKEINGSELAQLNRYAEGTAYYAVRIKHFGDDLTPWGTNGEKEPDLANIYPESSNARYLGRYGVLRNNWYVLELGTILKLGHPIVPWLSDEADPNDPTDPTDPDPDPKDPDPEDPDHPDDSKDDTFLAAKINILSWAKRPQGVKLK